MVTCLDGIAEVDVVLHTLGNVPLSGHTVLLHVSLLRVATHVPTLLAVDAPSYGVVGITPPVLSQFVASARTLLKVQAAVSLPGDFWPPEENALATLGPSHMQNRSQLLIETSGAASPVTLG